MNLKRTLQQWGLVVLILLAFVFILWPYGPGVTFDTASFLQAGNNFWDGLGYVHFAPDGGLEFAAHRFPLYPLLLSLTDQWKWGPFVLQILLFGGSLLLLRLYMRSLQTPKHLLLLFLTLPFVLGYYALWTESLYILLFLGLAYVLTVEEKRWANLLIVLLVVALCLTRMTGLVVGCSLALAFFISNRRIRALEVLVFTIVFVSLWIFLGTYFLGETARPLVQHWVDAGDLFDLVKSSGEWLVPVGPLWLTYGVGIFVLLFPLIVLLSRDQQPVRFRSLYWFLIIYGYAYLLFLILSKSLIDASIPFESRTLLPLYVNQLLLLVLLQSGDLSGERMREKMRFIFAIAAIAVVGLNAYPLHQLRQNGVGYNSAEWRSYAFVPVLQGIHQEQVYTNDQSATYLFSPFVQKPKLLPQKVNLYTEQPVDTYSAEMDLMLHDLQQNGGQIVWIRNGATAHVFPDYEELKSLEGVEVVYDNWLLLVLRVLRSESE